MVSKSRLTRIEQKFLEDQAHLHYLLKKGWKPWEIADQQIHFMILMMKNHIELTHPEWSQEKIRKQLRKTLHQNKGREYKQKCHR